MILHKAGIDLGWLFYAMGTLLGSAVAPIALTVGWSKLSKAGGKCATSLIELHGRKRLTSILLCNDDQRSPAPSVDRASVSQSGSAYAFPDTDLPPSTM